MSTPSEHSVLSPSGHDRWGNCAGALAACKHITERRSSEAAAKGTAKHAISEKMLRDWSLTRDTFLEETAKADGFEFDIDDEFMDHVETYVDYVKSRPGRKHYEVRLSTAHIFGVPGQAGTADCIHQDYEEREIEVIDAKFGYIPVSAQHKQLRDYGAAALTLYDLEGEWDTVRCTIVQPQDDEPVKTQVFTRAQIEAFIEEERPKAQLAFRLWQNPPVDLLRYLTPSDEACAWCPIAGACVAKERKIVGMFRDVTATTPDVVLLSDERLAELRLEVLDIVEWAKAIDVEAFARAMQGRTIPGNKLIYGKKGKRVYVDGSDALVKGVLEMALGVDEMYAPRKIVSPTKAEEMLKKAKAPALYEKIRPYVTQADPRLKLVPLSAKGDPVTVAAAATQFEVVK